MMDIVWEKELEKYHNSGVLPMNLWNLTRTFALALVPLSPNDSDEKWGETYLQLDINSDKKIS